MDPNEAASALAEMGRTEKRLAAHAHWPFHRHAMFGLSEGLIVRFDGGDWRVTSVDLAEASRGKVDMLLERER